MYCTVLHVEQHYFECILKSGLSFAPLLVVSTKIYSLFLYCPELGSKGPKS